MLPPDIDINKGVELLLRGEKPKPTPQQKNLIDLRFTLFNKEFSLSFNIKDKTSSDIYIGQSVDINDDNEDYDDDNDDY